MTDIEADRLGPRAIEIALGKAEDLAREGDVAGAERWRGKARAFQEYFEAEEAERHRKARVNPAAVRLHAGIAGLRVEEPIEIASGLQLAPTYAHVMAPFIMAFNEPAEPEQGHRGPWKSASGGSAIDIHAEATLDESAKIGIFDRLNSIWFLATLLRLRISTAIRVPVVSDTAFVEVPGGKEPVLWPIEFRRPIHVALHHCSHVQRDGIAWIGSNMENGATMMRGEGFALAFQTLDQAWFAESRGSAMVLLWSAIESLFRPRDQDITKTLARMIATYLTDDPRARDRRYQEIKALYKVRGEMVHAARTPAEAPIDATAGIARRAFIRAIEHGEVPDAERLRKAWSERTAY